MTDLRITTNNVPRDIIDSWQLTPREREDFDYIDWTACDAGTDSASFVRYRGELYDLGEFEVWDNPASPTRGVWDGIRTDSFFSGLVIRYANDGESVIVGRYCS